ncbi:MAG: hypothetical protein ACO3QC_10575, partial [Phycisphaerales bacterium]
MLRTLLRASCILLAFAVVGRALAATVDVYAYNTQFSLNLPGEPVVTRARIFAGDSVRWVWLQGNHRTVAAIGSSEQWNAPLDSQSPTYTRQFNNPGVFWYRCDPHGIDNGDGTTSEMYGIVEVYPVGYGACCKPDGSCDIVSPNACVAAGGSFAGANTLCSPGGCGIQPITVTLQASADAMLFESATGTVANGSGIYNYLGNASGGARRRFAVRFDTSIIPAGGTVVSAELGI